MALSITEIKEQYESFLDEIQEIDSVISDAITEDLSIGATSVSKSANWRLLRFVWSAMSFLQQSIFDLFKAEVEEIANNSPKMNSRWMADEVKKFQYGDPLLWNDETRQYYYGVPDPAKQIVTRVAVEEKAGLSVIKVAKDGPVKLTIDELDSFNSFVRLIQPTGSNLDTISQDPDEIHLPIEVVYDPIIPKATVQQNVETAVQDYLESLSFGLREEGVFYTINLVDSIQEVDGVVDVIPGDLKAWPSTANPLEDDPFDRKYSPVAGYIVVYALSPLDQVITYTPKNG